jgi:type II secretion system protein J
MIEVILAAVLIGFIAIVSIGLLQSMISGRERLRQHHTLSDELRLVASTLQNDLNNMVRTADPRQIRFVATSTEMGDTRTSLIFNCIRHSNVRRDSPESDVYEVEYSLEISPENQPQFYVRRWPAPDPMRDAPGGVLLQLSDHIGHFSFRFLDGNGEWQNTWTEESRSIPKLTEISLFAQDPDTDKLLSRTFVVHHPRWPSNRPNAR